LEPFSRQMCSNLNRICRLELTLRQMCSVLSEICRLEPFSRQMCSDLNRICRLEPASRQRCSNLNSICHLERLCPDTRLKKKIYYHTHDLIIYYKQYNLVRRKENDSTQLYLKLRRTKRTNY